MEKIIDLGLYIQIDILLTNVDNVYTLLKDTKFSTVHEIVSKTKPVDLNVVHCYYSREKFIHPYLLYPDLVKVE